MRIIEDNKDTEFGKKHEFDKIKTVEDYKKLVPLRTYDDYAQAIDRMIQGEQRLITNYLIVFYAVTSGSMDNPKNIPVSKETLEFFSEGTSPISKAVFDSYIRELKGRAPNSGKQFIASVIKVDEVADKTMRGPISSAVYTQLNRILSRFFLGRLRLCI